MAGHRVCRAVHCRRRPRSRCLRCGSRLADRVRRNARHRASWGLRKKTEQGGARLGVRSFRRFARRRVGGQGGAEESAGPGRAQAPRRSCLRTTRITGDTTAGGTPGWKRESCKKDCWMGGMGHATLSAGCFLQTRSGPCDPPTGSGATRYCCPSRAVAWPACTLPSAWGVRGLSARLPSSSFIPICNRTLTSSTAS